MRRSALAAFHSYLHGLYELDYRPVEEELARRGKVVVADEGNAVAELRHVDTDQLRQIDHALGIDKLEYVWIDQRALIWS
jgi:hypothetical protein